MINFINAFMSYGLLMLIIVCLCGLGVFMGITLRKAKNSKDAVSAQPEEEN